MAGIQLLKLGNVVKNGGKLLLEARFFIFAQIQTRQQGDVVNWLVSPAFGLQPARSIEAEEAIEAAEAWMRGDKARLPAHLNTQARIHKALQKSLPGHDDFWPRWIVASSKSNTGGSA